MTAPRSLEDAQVPEVIARYQAGETQTSIARAFGVHPATIWYHLRKHGVFVPGRDQPTGRPRRRRQRLPFTAQDEEDIERRYTGGENTDTIARSYSSKRETISRILRRRGIPPRTTRLFGRDTEEQIVERYKRGDTVVSIARTFGCNPWTVRNIVKRWGIPRRTIGAQPRVFTSDEMAVIADLARQGLSQRAIGKDMGASQIAISRAMATHGIPPAHPTAHRGPGHSTWKGGRLISGGGYVEVWLPADSPFASMRTKSGYVRENRLVMAQALGRPLASWETVHHIDGQRAHNALSNLQLRIGKHGNGQAWVCADCGSHNIVPVQLE